ncbi:flagellar hook-length control protein FliK [Rhodanobacter aciditrophus]|uniref:Flagellar hook-length control protein FliK n=1 Tax=Rhodanobacter aciditrophus TaxID=1623218 RepID=A0ABW4B4T2_9GAMM
MINSPSLSLTLTTQKSSSESRFASPAKSESQFGDVFSKASNTTEERHSSAPATVENNDKPKADQDIERVDSKPEQLTSEIESSLEKDAANSDVKSETEEVGVSEDVMADTDVKPQSDIEQDKDGKALQEDGQNVAVLPPQGESNVPPALPAEGEIHPEVSEDTESLEAEDTQLNDGSILLDKAIDGDVASDGDVTSDDDKAPEAVLEKDQEALLAQPISQSADDAIEELVKPQANTDGVLPSTDKKTNEHLVKTPEVGLTGQMASTSTTKLPETKVAEAAGVALQSANENTDKAESTNLKWVMEQLSSKFEKTTQTTNSNVLTVDPDLNAGEFEEGIELSDVLDASDLDLDVALADDLETQPSSRKSFDQVLAGLTGQTQTWQSVASNTSLSAGVAMRGDTPAQLTMQSLPASASWAAEMSQKVSWVANEGIKTAHIQLDPPELGSLTVKVTMDQDSNTHVSFVASSVAAKDALEGQMQRLREMLQQQGIDLDGVDVEVSQGNGQSGQSEASGEQSPGGQGSGVTGSEGLDDEEDLENVGFVTPATKGIDFYA